MSSTKDAIAETGDDPEDERYLVSDMEEKIENGMKNRQDNGRKDKEMVNVKHDPEYRKSGANLTRVLVVTGILGVVIFSIAALSYVLSGTIPFPADIF